MSSSSRSKSELFARDGIIENDMDKYCVKEYLKRALKTDIENLHSNFLPQTSRVHGSNAVCKKERKLKEGTAEAFDSVLNVLNNLEVIFDADTNSFGKKYDIHPLFGADIKRLKDGEWLNDAIINNFVHFMVEQRNQLMSTTSSNVLVLSSLWYEKLYGKSKRFDYEGANLMFPRDCRSLFDLDLLLIPIKLSLDLSMLFSERQTHHLL